VSAIRANDSPPLLEQGQALRPQDWPGRCRTMLTSCEGALGFSVMHLNTCMAFVGAQALGSWRCSAEFILIQKCTFP
jgi:hypothetical protein